MMIYLRVVDDFVVQRPQGTPNFDLLRKRRQHQFYPLNVGWFYRRIRRNALLPDSVKAINDTVLR